MIKKMFLFVLFACICLCAEDGLCSKAYVTDSFRISLRRGPSIENKILKFLPSGMPVEILESSEGWSHIEATEPGKGDIKGWTLSRYLINRLPWADQSAILKQENDRLRKEKTEDQKELETLKARAGELSKRLNDAVKTINKVQADFKKLKTESSKYLELKDKYLKINKKQTQLLVDNQRLATSGRNYFFGLGALVLLAGLVIGMAMGRRNTRRNSLY